MSAGLSLIAAAFLTYVFVRICVLFEELEDRIDRLEEEMSEK